MSSYVGFQKGKNGLFIVFPDGDATDKNGTQWASFKWYHPDRGLESDAVHGNLSWCRDGATRENGVVDNWFELMDSWFDTNDAEGGINRYRW